MVDNTDYKLGQLDQFKSDICNRVDKLEGVMITRLEQIEDKVDKNRVWRIKTVAFASGISATVTAVIMTLTFMASMYNKFK